MSIRVIHVLFLLLLLLTGCGGGEGASVYYLRPGPTGAAQLFRQPLDGPAEQLTGVSQPAAPEVIDFALSPDGRQVVYAAVNGDDGTLLRSLSTAGGGETALLDCAATECTGLVWSPDGQRLIYERRPLGDSRAGAARLYWLDPTTGDTVPLLDADTPGYGARFSPGSVPDGAWLSYVSPADEGVVLYRLSDGAQRLLSSRVGSPAAFSPDSAAVVVGDVALLEGQAGQEGESSAVYLYRTLLDGDAPRERLSPAGAQADSAPTFSPDGQWITFGRAASGTATGRQLWLMRADGSEARALTNDPNVFHGPPSWSADGRTLLYQRFDLSDPVGRPSVWLMDVATGEQRLLAEGGYLPVWGQ